MPISNHHSCVFIHIPRTGGTSIEKALRIHREWPTIDMSVFHGQWQMKDDYLQLQHLPYEEMKSITDISHTLDYLRFTFVRNPWERLVSEYYWQNLSDKITFSEFIKRAEHIVKKRVRVRGAYCHFRPQVEFLDDHLDFIGRFENFKEDALKLLVLLGIEEADVPHFGSTTHQHYSTYYDEQSLNQVGEIYRQDVQMLGYRFECFDGC